MTSIQPEMFRDDKWGQFSDKASIQSSSTCVQRLRCTVLNILHDWNNTLSPVENNGTISISAYILEYCSCQIDIPYAY